MERFKEKKSLQALVYLATKFGGKLNKMKALKLIWLSDRYHLRHYGRSITGDQYFAMKNGPVASCTRDLLQNSVFVGADGKLIDLSKFINQEASVDGYEYAAVSEPNLNVFSETDIKVLDLIFDRYKGYGQFTLSTLSHSFPEWTRYEEQFKQSSRGRYDINIDDFFINVKDKQGLFQDDEDYLKESKEIFMEYSA